MVQGGERIMIVESLEGGNKKERKIVKGVKGRNKKKERKNIQGVKGRNKKGKKDGERLERKKKERKRKKTVQWLEMKKQKRDALERTSLNGYDE